MCKLIDYIECYRWHRYPASAVREFHHVLALFFKLALHPRLNAMVIQRIIHERWSKVDLNRSIWEDFIINMQITYFCM